MISNFHTASQAPGPGPAVYTLAGFDNDSGKSSGGNSYGSKKGHRRPNRFWKGKGRKKDQPNSSQSTASPGGDQSLTYSSSSSIQTSGESTDSSEFGNIMKVLDMQDEQELARLQQRGLSKSLSTASVHSASSSLNYSTDGESQLEGSKLMQSITGGGDLLGDFDPEPEDEEPLDTMFQPAQSPKTRRRPREEKENKNVPKAAEPVRGLGERGQPTAEQSTPRMSGAAPHDEAPMDEAAATKISQQQQTKTSKEEASTTTTEDDPSDPSTNNHRRNAKKSQQEVKDGPNPWWKCELLEETLSDLPDPKAVKKLLKPYLCFL